MHLCFAIRLYNCTFIVTKDLSGRCHRINNNDYTKGTKFPYVSFCLCNREKREKRFGRSKRRTVEAEGDGLASRRSLTDVPSGTWHAGESQRYFSFASLPQTGPMLSKIEMCNCETEPTENPTKTTVRFLVAKKYRYPFGIHRPVDGQRTLERFSRVILAIVDVRIEVVRKSRIVRPWQRFQVRTYLANLDFFYRNLFATSR